MKSNILLTGMPKSGKSTMLEKLINLQKDTFGVLTREVRKHDQRVGFELVTHSGYSSMLAHVDIDSDIKVGKYGVDVQSLETILPHVQDFNTDQFLYLDELGQMQMYSEDFKNLATSYLDAPNILLSTISMVYSDDFLDTIKKRDDVQLIELTPETRDEQFTYVRHLLDL